MLGVSVGMAGTMASSSMILPTATAVPIVALMAESIWTLKVSSRSPTLLLTSPMSNDAEVCPAAIVIERAVLKIVAAGGRGVIGGAQIDGHGLARRLAERHVEGHRAAVLRGGAGGGDRHRWQGRQCRAGSACR